MSGFVVGDALLALGVPAVLVLVIVVAVVVALAVVVGVVVSGQTDFPRLPLVTDFPCFPLVVDLL